MKRILTVAGSDSGGGAGIQADLKTIAILGGYGMSVITALTAQNTLRVHGVYEIPLDFIEMQFDAVLSDIGVDAAKTGMLLSAEIVRLVARKVRQYKIEKLVVDPVIKAKDGNVLLSDEGVVELKRELIPISYLVMPNLDEAALLTDKKVVSRKDIKEASRRIHEMGARYVLIKGGHLKGRPVDILYDGREFFEFHSERIQTRNTHGTGCTYSSAIATFIAQGMGMHDAIGKAKAFITDAIANGLLMGMGNGPVNPFAPIGREIARYGALMNMEGAIKELQKHCLGQLVPEVRSNIGYAIPFARDAGDVIAVPGRITEIDGRMIPSSRPAFGASKHISRIILTVMKKDPSIRSAMNIRYSEDVISACREMGMRIASFDRRDEPEAIKEIEGSTLEWGTQRALKDATHVPDIIYDLGDKGKEPMVRVLGKDPEDVVSKVVAIGAKLKKEGKSREERGCGIGL